MKTAVQPLGEAMETVFAPFILQQTPQNPTPAPPVFPQAQTQQDTSSAPAPTLLFPPGASSPDCEVLGTLPAPPDSKNVPSTLDPNGPPAAPRPILKRKGKLGSMGHTRRYASAPVFDTPAVTPDPPHRARMVAKYEDLRNKACSGQRLSPNDWKLYKMLHRTVPDLRFQSLFQSVHTIFRGM